MENWVAWSPLLKLRCALLTRSLVCGDDQLQETSKILHDSSWCKYLWAAYLCVCVWLLQLNQVTSTNAGDLRLGLSFSYQFEAAGPGVSVLQWQSGDSHWDQSIQDEQPATLSAGFEWCNYTSGTIAILSLHILGKTPSKPNACCYRKAWWMGCASFVGPLDRILPSMYEPQKSGGILRSWQLAWWVDSNIFVFFVAVWLQSPTLRSVQQNTFNKSSAMAPMKAMAKSVKVMTKGALATELADAAGLKKGDTTKATGQYRSCVTCCFFLQVLGKYGSNTIKCEIRSWTFWPRLEQRKWRKRESSPCLAFVWSRPARRRYLDETCISFSHIVIESSICCPHGFPEKVQLRQPKARVFVYWHHSNLKQIHFHFSLYPQWNCTGGKKMMFGKVTSWVYVIFIYFNVCIC